MSHWRVNSTPAQFILTPRGGIQPSWRRSRRQTAGCRYEAGRLERSCRAESTVSNLTESAFDGCMSLSLTSNRSDAHTRAVLDVYRVKQADSCTKAVSDDQDSRSRVGGEGRLHLLQDVVGRIKPGALK